MDWNSVGNYFEVKVLLVSLAVAYELTIHSNRIAAFFLQFQSFQNHLVVLANPIQLITTTVIGIIVTFSITVTRVL